MYRCDDCGSGYLDPRPAEESIGLVYDGYYTHQETPLKPQGRKVSYDRFLNSCDNSYLNWRYGTAYQPSSGPALLLARTMPNRRRRLDARMRHLPRRNAGSKLLDFGCGNGDFLVRAREAGWDVLGLDFDPQAVETARARGLEVDQGGVDKLSQLEARFDVITLSHVIEHLHQPRGLIESCYRLLNPEGVLWVETPNMASQGHHIYGQDWRGLEPPRHLVLFTTSSLTRLLNEAGFRVVETMPEHPVLPGIFLESEALRAGVDPASAKNRYDARLRQECKKLEKRALADANIREFITLRAKR